MKLTTTGKWWLVSVVALLCFAPYALAQTDTLTFTGGIAGAYDGYGTGPYTIEVGNAPDTGPVYEMVCDDFADQIADNSHWTATAHTYSNLSGTLYGPGAATQYAEAITLAYALLFNTQGAAGSYTNNMIQFAIWALFQPAAVEQVVSHADWAAIQSWITWASKNELSLSQLAQWVIWTPSNSQGGGCTAGSCAGQEFFQYVPEGGTALGYLFLAAVSCFGAMFFRRQVRV